MDECGRVLISQRAAHVHQGGLWEFPGGKLEPAESRYECLTRELAEELGITVRRAQPLMRVRHAYAERTVLLDVWLVSEWHGTARGKEMQAVAWVPATQLAAYEFPAADRPVVEAIADLRGGQDGNHPATTPSVPRRS